MPLIAASPPQPIPIVSGFDYVTVDAQRRRIYAAHTASESLSIIDADTGKVLGQVKVGPMHGVAVDPATGHVFTGNGTDESVAEIDPKTMAVLRTADDLGGPIDAIAYDPANGHIYADEDDGTHMFVIDAKTMKSIASIPLPGHKPEYLAIDPSTHRVYQNISNLSEFVVVDGTTLKVIKTVPTPEIKGNHPLQYDAALGHVLIGGQNGVLAAYDTNGTLVGKTQIQNRVDQCDLDRTTHTIACAGSGKITVLRDNPGGAPTVIGEQPVNAEAHTLAIDPKTSIVWVVWPQSDGDFVQGYKIGR